MMTIPNLSLCLPNSFSQWEPHVIFVMWFGGWMQMNSNRHTWHSPFPLLWPHKAPVVITFFCIWLLSQPINCLALTHLYGINVLFYPLQFSLTSTQCRAPWFFPGGTGLHYFTCPFSLETRFSFLSSSPVSYSIWDLGICVRRPRHPPVSRVYHCPHLHWGLPVKKS